MLESKEIPAGTKKKLILLSLLSAGLLVWCGLDLLKGGFSYPLPVYFVLGVLVLLVEFFALSLPFFGYLSPALPFYFILFLSGDFALAGVLAALGTALRSIFKPQEQLWLKLFEISRRVIIIGSTGLAYLLANGGAQLLSFRNILAMLAAVIVYLALEKLLSLPASSLLTQEARITWNKLKDREILFNLAFIPLSLLVSLAGIRNPLYFLALALPLGVLYFALKLVISRQQALKQKTLEENTRQLEQKLEDALKENRSLMENLKSKVDELSIFFEVGQALGASLNLESTLNIILSMVRKLIAYQSCVIFLLKDDQLYAAKAISPFQEVLEMSSLLQLEESLVNLGIKKRAPILIPDMGESAEQRIFKGERSVMCVPMIVQNEILGVVYIGSTQPGLYSQNDLSLITILVNAGAIAMRSSQLYEAQQQVVLNQEKLNKELDFRVQQLEGLLELGQSLGSSLNLENTLNIIINQMKRLLEFQSCIIFSYQPDTRQLRPWRLISPYADLVMGISLSREQGAVNWVIREKRALLLEDTKKSRLENIIPDENSVIIVPLIAENQVIGVIYIGAPEPRTYKPETLAVVRTVAYTIAMAIKNAELYEKASALAITDGLTGLYTHRFFQERLGQAISWCKKFDRKLALLMIDTDHFKKYNDTLGHPEGDQLLKEIAALLKSHVRESDLVSRYGGDEFAVILRETDKDKAYQIAENTRKSFEEKFSIHPVKITASIGVACFPEDGAEKSSLIASADEALYEAKEGGRNRVAVSRIKKPLKDQGEPRRSFAAPSSGETESIS